MPNKKSISLESWHRASVLSLKADANHRFSSFLATMFTFKFDKLFQTTVKELHRRWDEYPTLGRKLTESDPEDIESVIAYLEADPYMSSSGYTEFRFIKVIWKFQYTEEQKERLCDCLLRRIESCWRQGWIATLRLARQVQQPWFIKELTRLCESKDPGIKVRARTMHRYCTK